MFSILYKWNYSASVHPWHTQFIVRRIKEFRWNLWTHARSDDKLTSCVRRLILQETDGAAPLAFTGYAQAGVMWCIQCASGLFFWPDIFSLHGLWIKYRYNSWLLCFRQGCAGVVSLNFMSGLPYFDNRSAGWLTSAYMVGDKKTLIIVGFLW